MSNYFTGIDIGTTQVRCVIGRIDEGEDVPTIVGSGSSINLGMRKGSIVNIPEVIAAVDVAVDNAEKTAGIKVDNAIVNINGVHITGINSKGVIAVNTANKEITPEEVHRVEEAATVVQLPANREIIQVFARGYRLDGQENIRDPLGMTGVRLEVDAHVVTATSPVVRNLERVMESVDIVANDRLMSGIAATNAVLGREQREHGVALVDIGGGTTNVAVIEEGDLQHVAVLPVGGINITNDLAIGLRTDLDVAEKLKLAFSANEGGKKNIKLKVGKKEHTFERAEVEMIMMSRLDELFEMVNRELGKIGRVGKLPGGVVLVGGTANLEGIGNLAKHALKLPVRVAQPSGFSGIVDSINSPEYTTVVGLMLHQFAMGDAVPKGKKKKTGGGGVGRGLVKGVSSVGKALKAILKRFKP